MGSKIDNLRKLASLLDDDEFVDSISRSDELVETVVDMDDEIIEVLEWSEGKIDLIDAKMDVLYGLALVLIATQVFTIGYPIVAGVILALSLTSIPGLIRIVKHFLNSKGYIDTTVVDR